MRVTTQRIRHLQSFDTPMDGFCDLLGWQGGTIHQVAEFFGVSMQMIVTADRVWKGATRDGPASLFLEWNTGPCPGRAEFCHVRGDERAVGSRCFKYWNWARMGMGERLDCFDVRNGGKPLPTAEMFLLAHQPIAPGLTLEKRSGLWHVVHVMSGLLLSFGGFGQRTHAEKYLRLIAPMLDWNRPMDRVRAEIEEKRLLTKLHAQKGLAGA